MNDRGLFFFITSAFALTAITSSKAPGSVAIKRLTALSLALLKTSLFVWRMCDGLKPLKDYSAESKYGTILPAGNGPTGNNAAFYAEQTRSGRG